MNERQFVKIRKKRKSEDIYSKPGIDSISRLFLISIRENLYHQRRKEIFKEYTSYKQHY